MFVVYMPAFKSNACSIIQTNSTVFISIVKGFAIHPIIFYHLKLHLRLRSLIQNMHLQSILLMPKGISTTSKAGFEAIPNCWATIPDTATYLPKAPVSQSTNNANDYNQTNHSSNYWSNDNSYLFVIIIALLQSVICLWSIIVVAASGHAFTPRWGGLCRVVTAVGAVIAICYVVIADCPFAELEVEGCAVLAGALDVELAAQGAYWWIAAIGKS